MRQMELDQDHIQRWNMVSGTLILGILLYDINQLLTQLVHPHYSYLLINAVVIE
jgi:hypothetical protein